MGASARLTIRGVLIAFAFLSFIPALKAQRDAPASVQAEEDRWEDKIIISLTHDFWLDTPEGVDVRVPSLGFKAHLFSDYAIKDGIVSFAWGLGFSSENVHSNARFQQEVLGDATLGDQILTPFPDEYEFERSKFNTTFLEIPIEFRVITKGRSPFKFAAGFKVGYMLGNKWKIDDTEGKRKFFDFNNMNKWRYGLTARLGVGKVQLTGFYSLVPLVEPGKGTEVIPVSLGLAFTFIK
jgi:hypothetical protein